MTQTLKSKKFGALLVAALAVLTLAGHFITRQLGATPTLPGGAAHPAAGLQSSDALVTLAGQLDRTSVLQGGDGQVRMELTLKAADISGPVPRSSVDMIVVLDRSPSMAADRKIDSARAAIHELINQLHPEDRLSLVAFAGNAKVLIPLTKASPEVRESWHHLVDGIELISSTNISAGLDMALSVAREIRQAGHYGAGRQATGRMLLISDGEANQGDTSTEGLTRRAMSASHLEFVLSSIGVGEGFNEVLMATLADAGTGNYYYLSDTHQLAEVFGNEFEATRATVASSVVVSIEPAPGVEVVDAAGYPLEKVGGKVTFRPGTLFSGQERRVWVTLQVPNGETGESALGTFSATYAHDGQSRVLQLPEPPRIACVANKDTWLADIDKGAWERSVVEEDYGRLRQRVASHVRSGQRQEAVEEIQLYEQKNRVMNETLASDEVEFNLQQLKKLEADVDDAFSGRDQAYKQKVLSKQQQADSLNGRRAGAKMTKKPPVKQH